MLNGIRLVAAGVITVLALPAVASAQQPVKNKTIPPGVISPISVGKPISPILEQTPIKPGKPGKPA